MEIINNFISENNKKLLWEVLLDELEITNSNVNVIKNVREVFELNIPIFIDFLKKKGPASNNMNLTIINKHFLSQSFISINALIPNLKQMNNVKYIKISDDEINEPYKIEDIQNVRQNNFDNELIKKRSEFEDAITLKKPKFIDFSDKNKDEKITGMDKLIEETILKRNFDVNTFQNNKPEVINEKPETISTKNVSWEIPETIHQDSNIVLNKLKKFTNENINENEN